MILSVKPAKFLKGSINLPASKSYSIRAFIIAACGGTSLIVRPSNCDDALVACAAARYLGARVIPRGKDRWLVTASAAGRGPAKINVRESGTTLRLLLPLVALQNRRVSVVGEGTLKGRPNAHLTRILRRQGVEVRGKGAGESVPVEFRPGTFEAGLMEIEGTLSSQFISALLIACPNLDGHSRVRITGKKPVSLDYIEMTRNVLRRSGITVKTRGPREYSIPGGQTFRGLKTLHVPSDYGLAAFPMAAALLAPSRVTLKGNLRRDWIQADGRIMDLLKKMGARVKATSRSVSIRGPQQLEGGRFSLKDCPDLVPVMSVLALFAKGPTTLADIGHVRTKESDRISDLRRELVKIGADIRETAGLLTIRPRPQYRGGVQLDPHRDHRLAMAFAVLGLKVGVKIKDIECTAKSYPDFVRDMRRIAGTKAIIIQ